MSKQRGRKKKLSSAQTPVYLAQFAGAESTIKSILLASVLSRGCSVAEIQATPADVSKYTNSGIGSLAALSTSDSTLSAIADKLAARGNPYALTTHPTPSWPPSPPDAQVLLDTPVDVVTSFGDGVYDAWQSEASARDLLASVAALLAPGGVFVGYGVDSGSVWYKAQKSSVLSVANFDGELYATSFADSGEAQVYASSGEIAFPNGASRRFVLVHFATMITLAAEYGLYVVDIQNAASFWDDHALHYPDIVSAFEVYQKIPSLAHQVQDTLSLFTTFVFRKADS